MKPLPNTPTCKYKRKLIGMKLGEVGRTYYKDIPGVYKISMMRMFLNETDEIANVQIDS